MAAESKTHPQYNLAFTFVYDGITRIVDNVEFEGDAQQIIGYEVRKGGKFSYKIKRYSLSKIKNLIQIDPVRRVGPKIGRPESGSKKR